MKREEVEVLLAGQVPAHLRQVLGKWRREIKEQWARSSLGDSREEVRAQGEAEAYRKVVQLLRDPDEYLKEVINLQEEESHEGI